MIRVEAISHHVRRKRYYLVEEAGRKVRLGRTQSYEAVKAGAIPVEHHGRFLLVPKVVWDRRVRQLLKSKE